VRGTDEWNGSRDRNELRASATTQYARVTSGPASIIGKRLAFISDRSANLAFDGSAGSFSGGLNVGYLGQTYADDRNTQPLGTGIVIDVKLNAQLGRGMLLTLADTNATNLQYLSSQDRLGPPSILTLALSASSGHARTPSGDCALPP